MTVPLPVVVSQRVDILRDRGERRDALDQKLCVWLSEMGFMPFPVPNMRWEAPFFLEWLAVLKPVAIVLSGGNDIGEVPERDETERGLLAYAWQEKLPLLGICRGMQMMGVWAGGPLKPVDGHVRTRHRLAGKISAEVNSFHNFSLKECPPGFEVLARAEDGEIEAIRHLDLPWEGWMWHPEREPVFPAEESDRVRRLFDA